MRVCTAQVCMCACASVFVCELVRVHTFMYTYVLAYIHLYTCTSMVEYMQTQKIIVATMHSCVHVCLRVPRAYVFM